MPSRFEVAAQELLAITAWYAAPSGRRTTTPLAVRFSGELQEARSDETLGNDTFVYDTTFEDVSGPGPVALTARIRDLTPGTWSVRAELSASRGGKRAGAPTWRPESLPVTSWSLRPRREPSSACSLQTRLPLFAVAPGVAPFVWAVAAIAGIAAGLAVQQVVAARIHPVAGPVLGISLAGIAAGVIGAKIWFVVLHRAERRAEGWCIQGFLTGFVLVAGLYLLAGGYSVGPYLASAAPGLLLGLAVGRVGCFFAGCCYGRPTSARWGVWSSNQRVGTKRIPTQLIESGLALAVAAVAGATVGVGWSSSGWVFVAAVAAYTAVRQAILPLRGEPRQSKVGPWAAAVGAVAALVVAVLALVL